MQFQIRANIVQRAENTLIRVASLSGKVTPVVDP